MQISQSDVVRVRRARWRVLDVSRYDGCEVLAVAGADPANAGVQRRFLVPFDDARRLERRARPLRTSRHRWRRACRRLLAADVPPGCLITPRQARIDLMPHQLEPALAVVRGAASRVLLADDVGLGKTIQAGLVASELRNRGAADRILVVTPAGLRDQWAAELSDRFGLDAPVVDVRALRARAASLPVGTNPWRTFRVAIVSTDLLKRVDILGGVAACRWDVVIVDEAHGVVGDTERHAAIAAITRHVPYVVLASATPHNGDRRAFASLCSLGEAEGDKLLIFRRSRQDVQLEGRRRIHQLPVRLTSDEAALHNQLLRFSRAVRRQHSVRGQERDCRLALAVLHKRALSSARSLQDSIRRRLASLDDETPPATQLRLPLDGDASELTDADRPPEWPALLAFDDAVEERHLLTALCDAAARAAAHESKIGALARLLRRVNEPAIVFTEYRDTLRHVEASLAVPCLTLHGGMQRADRRAVVERFTNGPVRILLATDAAAEGLNLQSRCRLVINLELPWNPMRLEQRIGRVDRIGQARSVHVFHLIARDSAESLVLARLRARMATVHDDVGGADPLAPEPARSRLASAFAQEASFADEARAEVNRIENSRRLAAAEDERPRPSYEDRPLLVRGRRRKTRVALARRTVMLWQVAAEDGLGRQAGSHLVAIASSTGPRQDEPVRQLVDQAAAGWKNRLRATHEAFSDRRLARERSIQAATGGSEGAGNGAAFQGGLFERRVERARLAVSADEDAKREDEADRLASVERSRLLSFLPPQLMLVLTP